MHRPWLRTWLLVFTLVLAAGQAAVGMRASTTASITGDEPFYLLTTQSLLSDGDLDLTDEYRDREYERFWDGRVALWRQMEPTADGRLLSPHNPGLSALLVPAYAAAGLEGAQRFLAVVWAAAIGFAALVALRLGAPRAAATVAAVAIGAGVPGLVYASQLYPEGAAALCVALALLVVTDRRARPLALVAVLTALLWLGVKYAPLALVLTGAWAWRFRAERRGLLVLGATGAASAMVFAGWHLWTFGGLTPYGTNVVWAGEGTTEIVDAHLRVRDRSYRLYGVFLDARFGLLRWLPVTLVGVAGIRRSTVVPVALLGTAAAVAAFASITIMGWWFPGRPLVAVLPALVVLAAVGLARLPGAGAAAGLALVVWSLGIAAAVAWSARTGGIRLAVDPWELGPPLPPAWLFPDFRAFGWREVGMSLAWAAVAAVFAVLSALNLPHAQVQGGKRRAADEEERVTPRP